MEEAEEFERLLAELLERAKEMEVRDSTIAYFLLREGTNYYFRDTLHKYILTQQD